MQLSEAALRGSAHVASRRGADWWACDSFFHWLFWY